MKFTTIGYWQSAPDMPDVHVVEAEDVAGAIAAAEAVACRDKPNPKADPYINTFVFAGEPELLSTWAG